jgi:hypothetical protein
LNFVSWGKSDGQASFAAPQGVVTWLNETSNAKGVHHSEQPEVTEASLASVDLVLLQDMSGWEFSDEEARVFKEWVQAGGAVMALSGYGTDGLQVASTNRLVSFAGHKFLSLSESGQTSTSIGECGYSLGTTDRQGGFDLYHEISYGVEAVGAFQGRAISGQGDIVAQEDGQVLAMAKTVEEGRVFLFHDVWISYSDKWQMEAPAECMDNDACENVSPQVTYQIPQLWFNAFRWLVPDATCFELHDDSIKG